MFLESFVENGGARRRWSTLISFTLQAVAIGMLLAVPLLYTAALPPVHVAPQAIWPGPTGLGHPRTATTLVRIPQNLSSAALTMPRFIPTGVHLPATSSSVGEAATGPGETGEGGPPDLGIESGGGGGPAMELPMPGQPLIVPTPPTKPLVISHLDEGMLLQRVDPPYPPLAKASRIEGSVVLTAVIDTHGEVKELRAVSGHPFLVKAALQAVSQWRYRPYMLDGQPYEVQTQITVNFRLGN